MNRSSSIGGSNRKIMNRSLHPQWGVLLLSLSIAIAGCTNNKDKSKTLDWNAALYAVQSKFVDNQNGTVVDSNGLMWMKCTQGQVWNAGLNNCTGTGGYTTYGAASMAFCTYEPGCYDTSTSLANSGPAFDSCDTLTFAGYSDWRLPTKYELGTIAANVDRNSFLYTFPQTPDDKNYWSSNINTTDSTYKTAWGVSFAATSFGQESSNDIQYGILYVRCARP